MSDFAAMDTGILDAEFTDVQPDGAAETALAVTDQTAEGTSAEATTETALATASPADGRLHSEDGKLSPALSTALASIKTTNPALAQELTRAAHIVSTLRSEFPGGLKEMRMLRDRAEQVGISTEESFARTNQELAGFREYDRQFMAGDPKFVETMIAAEPNAFQKLAPMMFDKFASLNPDGYKALVSKAAYSDLTAAGLPIHLNMASAFLDQISPMLTTEQAPMFERLITEFNHIVSWANGLAETARKAVTAPQAPAAPQQPNAGEDKTLALTAKVWSQDTGKSLANIFMVEYKRLAGGRQFSAEQRANFQELFSMRLERALKADQNFESRVSQYLKAGDQEGHLRYVNSMYKQHVPRIMAALIKPAQGAAPVAKPAQAQQPAVPGKPTPAGAQKIAGMPRASEISPETTSAMIQSNQAIMLDGRHVSW